MKQISFIDEATIKVRGGRGGDGRKAFHREKYVEHGGPSGGNGGDGGSIFFVADNNENTLLDFKGRPRYEGKEGIPGGKQNMTGARGKDVYIKVPVGTEILEDDNKVADLSFDGQIWLASKGGKGGRGNASFKSSKNTVPEMFELGEEPEWRELKLNLKVLADVGLLGFPNAGKSTLLSVVSNAKPKIANYEFTTLTPNLGVVKHNDSKFVMTDLPGLIEGASLNKGMGSQFLKHLSRTKVILHMIDVSSDNLTKRYDDLRFELKNYSDDLSNLTEIIAFTKSDLIDEEYKQWVREEFKDKEVFFISSTNKEGLSELLNKLTSTLNEIELEEERRVEELSKDDFVYIKHEDTKDEKEWEVSFDDGIWTVSGPYIEYWAKRIPLTNQENVYRIISKMRSKGIITELEKKGLKDNDVIVIKNSPFTYIWDSE